MDDWRKKCSVEAIRQRFDRDVERFSNLETGQVSTVDAVTAMELITEAAYRTAGAGGIRRMLDVGCGAGNNTLRLLERVPGADCDLVDLSAPMLARARERVAAAGAGAIRTIHGDFREVVLPDGAYDVILAAAVLHHLRDDADWERAFRKLYRLLRPGGGVWITDLVSQETEALRAMMRARYGAYLENAGGAAYRDRVFANIAIEDSPRPVTWQLELLRRVGFREVELLHKNSCFAAFGAIR